ncbi:MAG: cytochrome c3 family protein [Thermodesulfobacteriota bacterium]
MKDKINITVICLLVLFCSVVLVNAQSNITELKDEAFEEHEVSAAKFDHSTHTSRASCSDCHHVYEDGEKVPGAMSVDKGCSDCHKVDKGKLKLKYAYHTQCIGCHIEEDKGPVLCVNCHDSDMGRINEEVFTSPQRPAALFTHKPHIESDAIKGNTCCSCHHMFQKNKMLCSRIIGQECSDCHLKDIEGGEGKRSLRNAYHNLCIDCHQEAGEGPLACGECHKKY